jgi:putative DNA primase/helicase
MDILPGADASQQAHPTRADTSPNNGSSPIDLNLLAAILADGPHWIVAHEDDDDRLRAYGFPVICLPLSERLTQEMVKPLTKIAVLQRPGPEGAAFGVQVKQDLEALKWVGPFTRCPLPDGLWDLVIVERETGPDRFGSYILSLLYEGLREQLGAAREPEYFGASASSGGNADEWPEPAPLPQSLPVVEAFEPTMLPEALRPWIEDISERMQCPPDYPAVGAMEGLATVVGRRVGIRPKRRDDWLVVPNLWGGVAGSPGVLKTPALQEALRPLSRLEFDAGRAYEAALEQWRTAELIAKEQEKVDSGKIREALKKGQDAKALAEQLLASAAAQPVRQRYIVNDSTVEKLGELLNQNPNGLLLFGDELSGFLRNLNREGHESDRAFYLEAWNGTGRFVYDRIGRGTVEIEAATISILGGIQPGPLAHYLRAAMDGGAGDDGLMQRFQLLVWPDVPPDWKNIDRWPDSEARQRAYEVFIHLNRLISADINADCDESLGGIPYLRFDAEAQEIFDEWRAGLERRIRSGEEHPALEAHLAKYRSLVPSLALLIHLANRGKNPVALEAVERACAWADFLESHARRVYGAVIASEVTAARALASRILKGDVPREFALRDVYRQHWAHLSTREDAAGAVEVLVDLDWLRGTTEDTGGRRRRRFLVNPRIWEGNHEVA